MGTLMSEVPLFSHPRSLVRHSTFGEQESGRVLLTETCERMYSIASAKAREFSHVIYGGTSLIRNTHPLKITISPQAYGYCRVLRGTPVRFRRSWQRFRRMFLFGSPPKHARRNAVSISFLLTYTLKHEHTLNFKKRGESGLSLCFSL